MSERKVYASEREDGRFGASLGFSHYLMKSARPRLSFDPAMPASAMPAWQERVRAKVRELMAFPADVPPQPAPALLWSEARDGYELQKWEVYPESGSVAPILMLVPDGCSAKSPAPAVLCFPGSTTSKELLAGEPELTEGYGRRFPEHNRMGWWYVREGMVAVCVENPATAELLDGNPRVYPEMRCLAAELVYLGRNYVGLSAFQKLAALRWVRTLDFVDPDRIALSGHSLGTEPMMALGALDRGVAAMVFNDFLAENRARITAQSIPGESEERWWVDCLPHLIPGLLEWVNFGDILAAYAPRPLIITEGGETRELERVRAAYELLEAGENFQYHYYPKYADPADRKDGVEIPEGVTLDEYFVYANVDAPNHYFKERLAVPWLKRVFGIAAA